MVVLITRCGAAAASACMTVGTSVPPQSDESRPLEVVAVDVSEFPLVVVDVALPDRELAGDVRAGALEMPGATGAVAEALLTAELTVALVLDDGRGTAVETITTEQGAVTELVRNIPEDVELLTATASGAIVGPTTDRVATLAAVGALGTIPPAPEATVATAAIRAAAALEAAPDERHQLVVLAAAGVEVRPDEAELLMASLDRSGSALRVLSIGGDAGPMLAAVAAATGGFAVDVGTGPAAALRAADALTTTFTDQYRVTATVPSSGDQLVRLTMSGRRYETVVPDIGASQVPPTPTAAETTTTAPTTPPTTTPVTGPAQGPPSAPPEEGSSPERSPSLLAGAPAIVAVAAIGAVVAVWRRRRR